MYLSWIEYVATNYSVGGSNPSLPENKLDYTFMAFAKITYKRIVEREAQLIHQNKT